jgi:hypothetical protein
VRLPNRVKGGCQTVFLRRISSFGVAILIAAGLAVTQASPLLAATSRNYGPNTATDSCPGTTVQACIDVSSGGDSVFMFTNAASESVSITTTMSLKSGDANQYQLNFVSSADPGNPATPTSPVFITIAGLSVAHLGVFLNNSTGSTINIRNVLGRGSAGQGSTFGIDVETGGNVNIEHSTANSVGAFGDALGLLGVPNGGTINFRVVGNSFDGNGNPQSGDGIALNTLSSGNVNTDIYNNSIWDIGRSGFAGIFLSPSGTVHNDINVVGNTVEKSGTDGLQQRNLLTAGGSLSLDIFNNSFSHAADFGVRLDNGSAVATNLRAGFNNYFANSDGNQRDGLSLGSNNLAASPSFVAGKNGNLRLKANSPLINKGQTCSPGGVANPDADNLNRLFGSNVDIGAYERDATAVSGVVLLGTNSANTQNGGSGDDILCGYGGNDQQFGMAGNDFMDGGDNNDFQMGNSGADRMLAGKGNDTLCANDSTGTDFLDGGKGTDKFKADTGDTRKSVEQNAGTACAL